jgi:hypothetical protein
MEKASPCRGMRPSVGEDVEEGSPCAFVGGAWPPPLPPWASPAAWRAVTAALDHHLRLPHFHYQSKLQPKAGAIISLIMRMERPMNILSRETCSDCEDPCCRRATLWYDFVDLLVIGASGHSWPLGQPMATVGSQCRYLGPSGCRLPRIQRPWICTWYLCPRQTAQLEATRPLQRRAVARMMADVKRLRKALEVAFIHVAVGIG